MQRSVGSSPLSCAGVYSCVSVLKSPKDPHVSPAACLRSCRRETGLTLRSLGGTRPTSSPSSTSSANTSQTLASRVRFPSADNTAKRLRFMIDNHPLVHPVELLCDVFQASSSTSATRCLICTSGNCAPPCNQPLTPKHNTTVSALSPSLNHAVCCSVLGQSPKVDDLFFRLHNRCATQRSQSLLNLSIITRCPRCCPP